MNYYVPRTTLSMLALCCSTIAIAGSEPLYQPSPNWIDAVDPTEIERDLSNTQVVNDVQIRIEDSLLWEYSDIIYRVGSLADLSNMGTLTAQWMPDKGDLIVHEVSILRDGKTVDLIDNGESFEVLRRERGLEQRILDGSLTATLAVPGLELGDELRMRYSVTTADQALGKEVQSQNFLYRQPQQFADFARIRASWPTQLDVRYQAGPNFDLPALEQSAGYNWVEIELPLDEADDLPADAPLRYRRGTLLQIGTFADWAEVSSIMAPYYETEGALDGLPDLSVKVDAIKTRYETDLERAIAALELVQEDIRYLLNGLDGGNYLPQDVATTWDKKYGDCKAKTLILLALLDELGIASEAILVSSRAGNAVPISLPIPGAFDHVLVRAEIDGNLYYLDGTSLGANTKVAGNVPPFEYALPVRHSGAEIERIEQVLPRYPDFQIAAVVDASAGGDLPMLATMTVTFVGPAGSQMNAQADKLTDDRKRMMGRSFGNDVSVLDVAIEEGDDDSEATIRITGLMKNLFDFDGIRAEFDLTSMISNIKFAPDRSRPDWRDIPVSLGAASHSNLALEATLPADEGAFEIRGEQNIEAEVAGAKYLFDANLSDNIIRVTEKFISNGGEIAPESFREERRNAAALARNTTKLVASDGMVRRWRYALEPDRSALQPLEEAFAQLVANDPDEVDPYLSRAAFRFDTFDFAGALEDMNAVIELEATAEYYGQRSNVHAKLLDLESSISDREEAYSLDPSAWRAMHLARELIRVKEFSKAREILEYEDGDEQVRQELNFLLAELDALDGDAAAGLARLDEMLADKPNDSTILNSKCWFMATWSVDISDGISVCTKAVENSGKAASILDSRAMNFLRNGMLDEALSDIQAGLDLDPGLSESVLLRGLIRLERGDEGGQDDIKDALARDPDLALTYRRWGFDL